MGQKFYNEADVQAIAAAIRAKNGTQNTYTVSQMPAAIAAITTGVPTVLNPALVLWDWEGTKLAGYSAEDALALTELPNPGTLPAYAYVDHELLLFQKWNWSLANIKTWIQNHEGETRDVGAIYTTTDGQDHNYWGNPRLDSATTITMQKRGTASIGSNAFNGCNSLTQINIPDSVTSIGSNAFNGCYSLTQINIPDGVTSIGGGAFNGCYNLTQITIPDSVTSIGNYAFSYCYSLTQINIPDSVTSIGSNAFQNCRVLTQINIPDGVTSIGSNAFNGCYSLTQIKIPDSVTSIGDSAFNGCRCLNDIVLESKPTLASTTVFSGLPTNYRIYVPRADLSWFETATNWSTIYAQGHIVAIEDYINYLESIATCGKNGTHSQMPAAIAAITTGVPAETLVYAQRNAAAGAFVDEVTYDPADYTVSRIAAYAGTGGNDKPLGGTFSAPENGRVVLLDSGRCAVLTVSAGNNTLYNITPNTTGAFVFLTQDDRIGAVGTLRPGGALRMLKLNDASNVRDLGGWACDGGTVRYGKLFRGSRLFISGSVNAYDKTVLHDLLGIQHELDLRYANELERDFSLIGSDVDWTHIDGAWYAIRDSAKCRAILECVFDCVLNGIPLYFHCAGGADRTGTLSMWLEALLGVSQSDIDKDYELTSFFSGVATDAQARRRNESEWQGLITAFRDYPGDTIRDRVFAWTVTLGIPVATINAFRAAMINGTPQALVNPYGTVAVGQALTRITIDNAAQSTEMYQPYTATLSADSGYSLAGASVAVTMGGVDVTADCYQNGVIHIEQVTGALIITATAVTQITNQILYGTDTIGGTALYNGTGYKQGYRWTSSNTEDNGEISGIPNKFAVGYIKVEPGDVVHLYGDIWKGTAGGISMHVRSETDGSLVRSNLNNWSTGYTARPDIMAYMSDIDYDDTTKTLRSFRWTGGTSAVTGYMHWTFVGVFDAHQTVLTINELVIPYGTVAVNKIFAHITIDNAAQSTEMYQPYTATLSADSGYSLAGASVAVTMGGVDVTADCYQNGVIHIEQVTGALTITATAAAQYTNQILFATDAIGGTALYNGTGYKQGYRWTTSNTEDNGEISGIPNKFAVGYIKVEPGDVVHLYGDIWKGTSGGISMHVQNATDTRLVRATLANWSDGYTARSDIMAYMSDIDYDDTTKTLRSFRWTGGTSAVTGYMHWTFVGVFDAYQTVLTINEEM